MGGENLAVDVVAFPVLGKRMVRVGGRVDLADLDAIQPYDPMAGMKP